MFQIRGGGTVQTEKIKIVVSLPARLGSSENTIDAMKLALEEEKYHVGNFSIELVVLDDGDETGAWIESKEKENAEKAVKDPAVIAYLGPTNSGAAKISMPILNRAGIPQLSPATTWPGLTKIGFAPGEPGLFYPTGVRHFFRVCSTDDKQGPAGALWVRELGFKDVYIIDDGETYGKGIADLFEAKAKELDIKVLGHTTLDLEAHEYTKLVATIKPKKPDLIYFGGITPNGVTQFIKDLHKGGVKSAIMGPDGILEQDFVDRTGAKDAEGVYATTVGADVSALQTEKAKLFRSEFLKKYAIEPEATSAYGYEAMKVVLRALSGITHPLRAELLSAIRITKNFDGLFGPWSFDQNGDTTLIIISGNQVHQGKFQFVEKLSSPD